MNQRQSGRERLKSDVVRTARPRVICLQKARDKGVEVRIASRHKVAEWQLPDVMSDGPCLWNCG